MSLKKNLEFFRNNVSSTPKATVHKSGRLGFNGAAEQFMDLQNNKYFKIGRSKQNAEDSEFFMIPVAETKRDEFTFKVLSGRNPYIRIKQLLTDMAVEFRTQTIIFDIEETEDDGDKIFKLVKR